LLRFSFPLTLSRIAKTKETNTLVKSMLTKIRNEKKYQDDVFPDIAVIPSKQIYVRKKGYN
jgi:hypothetical protein